MVEQHVFRINSFIAREQWVLKTFKLVMMPEIRTSLSESARNQNPFKA